MKKRIKIQGTLIFLATISIIIFRKVIIRSVDSGSSLILDLLGVLFVLSGYYLRIISRGCKAELNPDGKTLVVNGPYAFTRNPMYLGTMLIGIGIIILLLKWWAAFIFIGAYLIIYIPEIKKEEIKLLQLFGEKFSDYCKQVPRFFPKLNLKQRKKPVTFKFAWIKKELSSIIATALLVLIIRILFIK